MQKQYRNPKQEKKVCNTNKSYEAIKRMNKNNQKKKKKKTQIYLTVLSFLSHKTTFICSLFPFKEDKEPLPSTSKQGKSGELASSLRSCSYVHILIKKAKLHLHLRYSLLKKRRNLCPPPAGKVSLEGELASSLRSCSYVHILIKKAKLHLHLRYSLLKKRRNLCPPPAGKVSLEGELASSLKVYMRIVIKKTQTHLHVLYSPLNPKQGI
ncbi:hypothetical protein POVWA2_036190 [Plasmodium ovale wallikeri]|uniref:Uncharacterized protein n=1 Tax=Plasmodium ovale wallikeri TaxID=864142 RepID=A0A1A8Z441_PLAOA|nr:hypothetical protein POVWA1_036880 [Plasmodium ovale wallikeri]SBT38631.1 hypothetical protein POVWA2_036190 [Plasmodium ovale wallikeri]